MLYIQLWTLPTAYILEWLNIKYVSYLYSLLPHLELFLSLCIFAVFVFVIPVQLSCLVVSDSLWSLVLQHARLPCPSPTPGACSNSCPSSQWCHPIFCPLPSPSPPAFSLSQHQAIFEWVSSSHQVARVLELHLEHQSFQWIFRTDFL